MTIGTEPFSAYVISKRRDVEKLMFPSAQPEIKVAYLEPHNVNWSAPPADCCGVEVGEEVLTLRWLQLSDGRRLPVYASADLSARAAVYLIKRYRDSGLARGEEAIGPEPPQSEGHEWLRWRAERDLIEAGNALAVIYFDRSAPQERVRKLGKKWAVRAIGSHQDFPILFRTRKEAIARAEQNAIVAVRGARARVEEARELLALASADLARWRRDSEGAK